jgi:CRISPR-associated protein Csh1
MLQTLLRIGEWQSEGKSEWDRFLEYPKAATKDKHGNSISNYTLPIIFDLDNQEVIIDKENLEEYDERKISETIPLKIKGGNNKAIYTAVPAIKLEQIYKTFFGKYDFNDEITPEFGQLIEAIEKFNTKFLTDEFRGLLDEVFELREKFLDLIRTTNKKGEREIKLAAINDRFELNPNENIVFLCVKIKAEKYGMNSPTLFSNIKTYKVFLEESFLGGDDSKVGKNESKHKLCYASGLLSKEVNELALDTRYSLNKMFVTETKNYASSFHKKNFNINYQVSDENQTYLDYASDYFLNHGYKTRIANIDHVIIPQFLANSNVDLEMAMESIKRNSNLLFNLKKISEYSVNIGEWLNKEDEIFWINFIAFESDGNFFKSTEVIKDVSNFHFDKLIENFYKIDKQFRESDFVNWETVMKRYGEPRFFNFNSLYEVIPIRKDKEKKNKALELFKTILENRKVEPKFIYDYFTELILCHHYKRYASYTNVQEFGKDFFYFAVRDSVFKYLAFFQLLKKLKLIDMDETTPQENIDNRYDQAEKDFFTQMGYKKEQRAMFYLGRMLNSVEYLQKDKNKTVIQKVNFNGMDKDSIQRLRIDLIEKAKQYNSMNKVVFTDQKFGNEFDFNNWSLNPQEATFFMLTGYSFGAGKKIENKETEEEQ